MRAIADGDSNAFGRLYARYSGIVYALCLRIVRNRSDADEVLLEIFWELWDKSARYDPTRSKPLTYLLTLARSRAIDKRRLLQHVTSVQIPDESARGAPASRPSSDELFLAEQREAVAQSLQNLDPDQRMAIEYSFWDDMSHSEIALKLNKPLGTVKTWIRTGLSRLQYSLKEVR